MATPASPPFQTQPQSQNSTPLKPLPCVCILGDIRDQVLNKDERVRFQCLATKKTGRCTKGTRDFESSHRRLSQTVLGVLLIADSVITAEDFSAVVRMFFCHEHRDPNAKFKRYFETLRPHWKGDGNDEEKALLNAIREARLSDVERAVQSARPSLSPATLSKTSEEVGHGYRDPVSRMLFSHAEQSRHTRSRSDPPESSNNSHQLQKRAHQPQQELNHNNTSLIFSSDLPASASQNQVVNPRPNMAITASGASFALPIRGAPLSAASKRNERRRSNPPEPNRIFSPREDADIRSGRESHAGSADVHGSPSNYLTPSKRQPVPNYCTPQSECSSIPRMSILTPDSSCSEPTPIFGFGATPSQIQDETIDSTPSIRVRAASPFNIEVTTSPVQEEATNSTPSRLVQAAPTSNSGEVLGPSLNGQSNYVSDSAIPRTSERATNGGQPHQGSLRSNNIPLRQGSKDDTFLDRMTRSGYTVTDLDIPNRAWPVPPSTIDSAIRKLIKTDVNDGGDVYIFKAPEYFRIYPLRMPALLKIGKSVDINKRMNDIKTKCKVFDISIVPDKQSNSNTSYSRLEKLVHCELQNYQHVFECLACGTMHEEWYNVSEEVALQTVQRWRRFIDQVPYDPNGILKDHWSDKITSKTMTYADDKEQWNDAQSRNERWGKWLQDGIDGQKKIRGQKDAGVQTE
jgi:hypothetical protein